MPRHSGNTQRLTRAARRRAAIKRAGAHPRNPERNRNHSVHRPTEDRVNQPSQPATGAPTERTCVDCAAVIPSHYGRCKPCDLRYRLERGAA
jgi:hypothetical protein